MADPHELFLSRVRDPMPRTQFADPEVERLFAEFAVTLIDMRRQFDRLCELVDARARSEAMRKAFTLDPIDPSRPAARS